MTIKKDSAEMVINATMILFLCLALITTGAKGVWAGLIISIFIFILKIPKRPIICLLTICSPMWFLAILQKSVLYQFVMFVRSIFPGSIIKLVDPGTMVPRLEIFIGFFKDLKINAQFFFGHGIGSTIGLTKSLIFFDNMYLQILWEFGFIGIVSFLFIIYLVFRAYAAVDKTKLKNYERTLLNVSYCYIIMVMVNLYSSQSFLIRSVLILFICSVMIIFHLRHKYQLFPGMNYSCAC